MASRKAFRYRKRSKRMVTMSVLKSVLRSSTPLEPRDHYPILDTTRNQGGQHSFTTKQNCPTTHDK